MKALFLGIIAILPLLNSGQATSTSSGQDNFTSTGPNNVTSTGPDNLTSSNHYNLTSKKCRIPEFPAEHISAINTFFLQIRTLAAKGGNYSPEISLGPGGQMFGLRFSYTLYRKAMNEIETFGTLNASEYGLFRFNRTFNYSDAYEGKYTAVDGLVNLLKTVDAVKYQMIYPNATAYGCGMTVFPKENNECEMYVVCVFDK
ncbi:hypothetical protein NECAME_15171, partial [Necator americanus]